MKFGFRYLNSEIEYKIIAIDWIRRNENRRSYELRAVLSYEQNGEKLFQERYSNIQFGRMLRCGLTFIGDRFCCNEDLIEVSLPTDTFSGTCKFRNSEEYIHEDYLSFGDFKYKEDVEPGFIGQRILVATLKRETIINGRSIKFVTVPIFELIRFFLFGVNSYNEILLGGTVFDQDETNKIYNPIDSVVKKNEAGDLFKYVKIRKEIPSSCVQLVGDLVYNKKVREMANKLVSKINVNGNPFYGVRFPIGNVDSMNAYGRFVESSSGESVFEISSFSTMEYCEKYLFERDNDGRTTSKKDKKMKKIFGGKRKKKASKKPKKEINHDQQGDKNHEPVSITELIDEYEFDDRDTGGIQVEKIDQNYIAAQKKGEVDSDPIGVAPVSGNGGSGSGYAPIDNDIELKNNWITERIFWLKFPTIINSLKNELGASNVEISYLSNTGEYYEDACICHFNRLIETKDESELYFVRVKYAMTKFYVIELNPEEYDLPTIVFWDASGSDLSDNYITDKILHSFYSNNGNAKLIIKDLKDTIDLHYSKLKHLYFIRKSDLKKKYTVDDTVLNQSKKLAKKIQLQTMG